MSRNRLGAGVCAALALGAIPGAAAAQPPAVTSQGTDLVESVQQRAWRKRGAFALTPLASYAFNDSFLYRGGVGLRGEWWPRSLLGLTVEGSYWGQTPSGDARVAQRELRARLRESGSSWAAMGGAEISAGDGKLTVGGGILPFETFLRLNAGAASSQDNIDSDPVLAFGAGAGLRWFTSGSFGLETAITWRSASILRVVDGRTVPARDTLVSFELGVPWRVGGGR